MPPVICSAWPPASTRSSSANRRSSARSRKPTRSPRARRRRSLLNRLFHASFARRQARSRGNRARSGAVSVGFAAVALARKIFGDPRAERAGLGAGEMGKLTARHMKSQGVRQVDDRQPDDGARGAHGRIIGGARAAPWEDMDAALGASDIVITATGAGTTILTKAHIEAVMRPRRNRPLFIIDIAVPRDVERRRARSSRSFSITSTTCRATVRENLARRATEICARAEAIVTEEVGGSALAPFARRHPHRRRSAAEVREDPPCRARTRLDFKLPRCLRKRAEARAGRRDYAAHRREAAADAHRAAQGARRPGHVTAYSKR